MEQLIIKLVRGEAVTGADISNELYEICEGMVGNCSTDCPVFRLNGCKAPLREGTITCSCDKDGFLMAEFIKNWKSRSVSDKFTQEQIDMFKKNLQIWFDNYKKDGGEWESQLKEVFQAGYGHTSNWP